MPKVIISASGMATGGRVLHHLKAYGPDRRSLIMFAGYQAGGTRGAAMLAGEKSREDPRPLCADPRRDRRSRHAVGAFAMPMRPWAGWAISSSRPSMTFVVHGEPEAADALRHRIAEELGWT